MSTDGTTGAAAPLTAAELEGLLVLAGKGDVYRGDVERLIAEVRRCRAFARHSDILACVCTALGCDEEGAENAVEGLIAEVKRLRAEVDRLGDLARGAISALSIEVGRRDG